MTTIEFINGDCLEILKDISSNTIDLVIADLPFGCLTGGGGKEKGKRKEKTNEGVIAGCPWDIPIDLDLFWKEIKRILKSENSPVLMFCTTRFGYELIKSNPKWFRYDLVWNKERGTSFLTANKMPLRSHEMIYVFAKSGAYYDRKDLSGDFKGWKAKKKEGQTQRTVPIGGEGNWECAENTGTRCVTSVITHRKKSHTKTTHPTEKPVELYKFLIERYCPPGGTVLDPTAGSFNSCFAAHELKRNSIGIEKDEKFFELAEKKLEELI
jgi:site-specific DNA-methyltransferase (adenine-specific)